MQHNKVEEDGIVIPLLSVDRESAHCQLPFWKCSITSSVLMGCRTDSTVFNPSTPKKSEKSCGKMNNDKVEYKKRNGIL